MNRNNQEMVYLFHMSMEPDGRQFPDYFVNLTLEFVQEEGIWCGHCVELGTPAFASTREQTRQELLDATILQLSGTEHLNELEGYLKRNNVPLYHLPAVTGDDKPHQRKTSFTEAIPT